MADCVFCAIARAEVPAAIVFEDDVSIAFLDHRPVFHGHTLLISRAHIPTLPDLPREDIAPYFGNAQMLSRAVPRALDADGSFVAINNVVSQSVPHLHVHVVPRRRKDGLRGFFWPRTRYTDDAHLNETADLIRASIADLRG
jgi:histidine triad (HIT) family protein